MAGYEPGRAVAFKFAHLRSLPDHPLFLTIHDRIVAGEELWPLARWVHASVPPDDPLGTDSIDIRHLYRMLKRYKLMLPPHLFLEPTYLQELTKGVEIHVDVVSKLGALIRYQELRVGQFAEKEKDWPLGITSEQQRREVAQLADLLMKMRDTQIAFGLTPGTLPNQINVTPAGPDYEVAQDPLSLFLASNPQAIPMVMGALEQLIIEGKSQRLASGDEQEKPDGADPEPRPRTDAERGPTQRFGAD
jgi:hypothetical protein